MSNCEQDSSEVQNQLQGVLVTVKIQDPEKDTKEKRVRFNSLVEVRFIPKVKAKKEKKEDKERKKAEEKTNCDSCHEGKENVVNSDESDVTRYDSKNEGTKNGHVDASMDKKQKNTRTNAKMIHENYNNGVECQVVAREGFFLPKVTIGQEYDGEVLRTTKVATKPQPRNSINRLLRRGSKENRMHDLSSKAVVHLERQATEFCKEAEKLFEETSQDRRDDSTKCENVNETQQVISPTELLKDSESGQVLQRCKSFPDFSRRTSLPETKRPDSQEKGTETPQKKLSTSLPYINMIQTRTAKTNEANQRDSYTKLYLPQLQRKAEEIKRLNDTVLKKKPKYSRDRSPSSPSDSSSPIGFHGDKYDKNGSPPASSHSIVRYSHGLDIARLLNVTNSTQLFY